MKKIFKYFLLPFFSVILLLTLLLQWSWFQKSCLLGILKCNFKEVSIENYTGSLKQISIGKIFCKNKSGFVEITDFKFDWEPWKFLKFKGIYINDLKGKILIDLPEKIGERAETYQAGFFNVHKKSKNQSFLSYVKLPFNLNIENLNLWMRGNLENIRVENANISIQHLQPNEVGVCQYSSVIKLPFKQYSSVQLNGKFNLRYNKNSQFEHIKCSGNARIFGDKRYPVIAYKGFVDGTSSKAGEFLKLEVHCGQSSDFTLVGKSFKTTDHIFSLNWQTILDNSFLKLFNCASLPTLSILAEGTCHLNRKTLIWNTHSYLSVWGKNFESLDPTLKSLPYLSLKAQIDAELSEKFLHLKQYKAVVKEKGASKIFFDINSLQPITYDYKKGLKTDSEDNFQVLEVNFHEMPFAIINPYLQQYDYKLLGNLKSGILNIAWNEKQKQCDLALLQPLIFYVQKFIKGKDTCVTDVNCRIAGKCTLTHQDKRGSYHLDMLLTDIRHIPFAKVSQEGNWFGRKNYNTHKGDLFFNYSLAQNLIQLQPFGIKLNPDLITNLKYDVIFSEDVFNINRLYADIKSDEDEEIALKIDCTSPIAIKNGEVCFDKDEEVARIYANKYPLDFIAYKGMNLKGILSYEGVISNEKNQVRLDTKTSLNIKDFNAMLEDGNGLKLKEIDLNANAYWKNKDQWNLDLLKVEVLSEEGKTPLLSGNANICQEKRKTLSTEGKFSLDVTQVSAQPFALKYPGLVGEVLGQWQINKDKKIANFHANVTPLDSSVTFDIKSFYTSESKQLKSCLELRNSDHATDVQLDCTLEKGKIVAAQMNSDRIFLDDLLSVAAWGQSLQKDWIKTQPVTNNVELAKVPVGKSSSQKVKNTDGEELHLNIHLKEILANKILGKDIKGEVIYNHNKNISFKNFTGQLLDGNIAMNLSYELNHPKCIFDGNLEKVDLETLFKIMDHYKVPYSDYAQLTGLLESKIKGSLDCKDFLASRFVLDGKIKDGSVKIFNSEVSFGNVIGGFASSIGLLIGGKSSSFGIINFLNTYLSTIPFDCVEYNFERNNADKLGAKVSLRNKDLAIYTRSTVDTLKEGDWDQYPLFSELQLYASTESPLLNYFKFEKNLGEHQSYLKGPTCIIDGTLGKPNYSNLVKLILSSDPKKEERIQHPVGKILNSLFN